MVIGRETVDVMTFKLNHFSHKGGLFEMISLTLEEGTCCHVRGKNGTGKTTFLRKLAWALAQKEKTIELPDAWQKEKGCFYFFAHTPPFHPMLTVSETLSLDFPHALKNKIKEALTFWGLLQKQNAAIHTLSEGEKKRLYLMRLTLAPLPLWLLDEPFNNLDIAFQKALENVIEEHLQKGGIALIAHHGELPFAVKETLSFPLKGEMSHA